MTRLIFSTYIFLFFKFDYYIQFLKNIYKFILSAVINTKNNRGCDYEFSNHVAVAVIFSINNMGIHTLLNS